MEGGYSSLVLPATWRAENGDWVYGGLTNDTCSTYQLREESVLSLQSLIRDIKKGVGRARLKILETAKPGHRNNRAYSATT
jgi:hypothetical protein